MQKPRSLTDLIPAIAMGMPHISTAILDYLQVLDPDSGIRMRNPTSANNSEEWVHWRRPPYPASASDSESVKRSANVLDKIGLTYLSDVCIISKVTILESFKYLRYYPK